MRTQQLEIEQFDQLVADAEALAHDKHGPKVMQLPSGDIVRLFRRTKLLSSSTLWPYCRRFVRASRLLRARGIRTVEVTAVYRLRSSGRYVAVYTPVPGMTLRQQLAEAPDRTSQLLTKYTRLLATLHERGVFFRSIHFDNVILCPDGEMGLIDIEATSFRSHALRARHRARNFKMPLHYDADRAAIEAMGAAAYLQSYLDAAQLPARAQRTFLAALKRQHPLWRKALDGDSGLTG